MKKIYLKLTNTSKEIYLKTLKINEEKILSLHKKKLISDKIDKNLSISTITAKSFKKNYKINQFFDAKHSEEFYINKKNICIETKLDDRNTLKEYIISHFCSNPRDAYETTESVIFLNEEQINKNDLQSYFPEFYNKKIDSYFKIIKDSKINQTIDMKSTFSLSN